jgi:hypothetical protein
VAVRAWLEGDTPDLRSLAKLLGEGDVHVIRDADEDRYYLTAPAIDNPAEPGRFDKAAEALLRRINGMARVRDSSYRPVKLTGKYSDGDTAHVFAELGLQVRPQLTVTAVVVGPDGKPQPDPPSPWPGRLALAESNSDVSDVLDLLNRSKPPNWDELFKVHEIIQDSINGSIPKMGWASQADDDAFGPSANRRDVSGKDARHARKEKRPPPKRTMTIEDGRRYIIEIVAKWLDWLGGP